MLHSKNATVFAFSILLWRKSHFRHGSSGNETNVCVQNWTQAHHSLMHLSRHFHASGHRSQVATLRGADTNKSNLINYQWEMSRCPETGKGRCMMTGGRTAVKQTNLPCIQLERLTTRLCNKKRQAHQKNKMESSKPATWVTCDLQIRPTGTWFTCVQKDTSETHLCDFFLDILCIWDPGLVVSWIADTIIDLMHECRSQGNN